MEIEPKKPAYFETNSWTGYSGPDGFYWGKSFYPDKRCVHNDRVVICIRPSHFTPDLYEATLQGGLDDDSWVALQNYALTIPEPDLEVKIPQVVNSLLAAWNAVAS